MTILFTCPWVYCNTYKTLTFFLYSTLFIHTHAHPSIMDYLNTLSKSAPIHQAVELIQQSQLAHRWMDFYKRSTRNELTFLGAAAFLTLYNLSSYIKAKRQKLHLPPTVPFSLPLLGHSLYLMAMPNKFIDWCNKHYGELYIINMLGKEVTVASGKCAEEALKADQADLSLEEGVVKGRACLGGFNGTV